MRIVNFGSLNIDHVHMVENFVRPGETIICKEYQKFCGGKGLNQSIALANAGAHVFHAGKIGADGILLKNLLESRGVDTSFVEVVEEPTGHAMIQVNKEGENSIIVYGKSRK
jgi:ribokinase